MDNLNDKIKQAIKLLQVCQPTDQPYELCYSGGKDSDVILQLAKMANINYRAIYKNTTIDPPLTIQHAKANGVEIVTPEKNFFQLIEKKGMPSRWRRWCCKYFKEFKILDNQILGIRRYESVKRAERYKEPVVCRLYNKKDHVNQILPILDWTDLDVEKFIEKYNIKCHPLYYKDGKFDVKKRLGCIGCPLAARRKKIEQYKDYPGILNKQLQSLNVYLKIRTDKDFKNEYEFMFFTIFCDNLQQFYSYKNSLFEFDFEKEIKNYFNIR